MEVCCVVTKYNTSVLNNIPVFPGLVLLKWFIMKNYTDFEPRSVQIGVLLIVKNSSFPDSMKGKLNQEKSQSLVFLFFSIS